jgi:hypothetical protein
MRSLAKRVAFAADAPARRPRVAALLVHPGVLLLLAASMALGAGWLTAADAGLEQALLACAPGDNDDSNPASFEPTHAHLRGAALGPRAATRDGERRERQAS